MVSPSRHTITSLITANGRQFQDWSADYDLYGEERVHPQALFDHVRAHIEEINGPQSILTIALDDTILRKTGRTIPGTSYRKDPLGPPFNLNLVWAQRMLQLSAAVPKKNGDVRMIPVSFLDASTPHKPRKGQPEEHWEAYHEQMRQRNLNLLAVNELEHLQQKRNFDPLRVVVDGSYTNTKVLKNLPKNTTLIGRIRKDAHLNALPEAQEEKGRRRIYGKELPTPEELRQDPSIPWRKVKVFAAGKPRTLQVKTIDCVRWRRAGEKDLRLVVIRAMAYRGPGGKRLYRQPAYLICTDPDLPLEELLQSYIWRWDIEVNHRDEKTLLGVGQAQVRNEKSVWSVPASAVAAYAMLHVAAIKAFGWSGKPQVIPPAKWRNPKKKRRASTMDLINELRRELWASAIKESHLTDFMNAASPDTKSEKCNPNLSSSVFAANA